MSFENRGRHKRNNGKATGRAVSPFQGSPAFTAEGERLRKQWEGLTLKEKSNWGYNFENYRGAHETPTGTKNEKK